jgi:hypothetical protein
MALKGVVGRGLAQLMLVFSISIGERVAALLFGFAK